MPLVEYIQARWQGIPANQVFAFVTQGVSR